MDEMKVFKNPKFGKIRAMAINGEPWLCGKDVALALGYPNPRKALDDYVPSEHKEIHILLDRIPGTSYSTTIGVTFIDEVGTYFLIASSKLPDADRFCRWVKSEVFPSIRNDDSDISPEQEEMSNEEILALGVLAAQNIIEEKDKIIAEQERQIDEMLSNISNAILLSELAGILTQSPDGHKTTGGASKAAEKVQRYFIDELLC